MLGHAPPNDLSFSWVRARHRVGVKVRARHKARERVRVSLFSII